VKPESSNNLDRRLFTLKWELDFQYFLIFAVLGVTVGTLLEGFAEHNWRTTALWLIAKSLSFLTLFLFWISFKFVLGIINFERLSIWFITFIGALGGVVQVVSLHYLLILLSVNNTIGLKSRLLGGVLLAAIWLPTLVVSSRNFQNYSLIRTSTQRKLLSLGEADLMRRNLIDSYQELIEIEIQNILLISKDSAQKILLNALSQRKSEAIPVKIRELASQHFRLTSMRISGLQISTTKLKGFHSLRKKNKLKLLLRALREIFQSRPLNAELLTLVTVGTIALPLFRKLETSTAIQVFLVIGICVYLIQRGFIFIFSWRGKYGPPLFALNLALNIAVPLFVLYFLPTNHPQLAKQLSYGFCVTVITFSGHIAQLGVASRQELLALENEELEVALRESEEINLALVKTTNQWARYVHGTIQARLHACALLLEQAQRNGNPEEISLAISTIWGVIRETSSEMSKDSVLSLDVAIAEKCDLWKGLVDIRLDFDKALLNYEVPNIEYVSDAIEEAITNSVRHGVAQRIDIVLSSYQEYISIKVIDDGVGFTDFVPGFGSSIFNTLTNGNWTIKVEPESKETVLELLF
jgi:signal transduction histidine kinase